MLGRSVMTVLIAALATVGTRASAYELRKDSTGATVHWAQRLDFVFDEKAGDILHESKALEAAQAALATLQSAVPEISFSLKRGATSGMGYSQAGKNLNVIVALDEDWPFDSDAIAVTVLTVNTRTHEILDADIALNAVQRKFRVLDSRGDPLSTYDDVQNTLTHELGHAVGLGHVPGEPEAVMYPAATRGEVKKRALSSDDASGLAALYPAGLAESPSGITTKAQGCSAATGPAGLLPWLAVLGVLAFRRMRAATHVPALLVLAIPTLALASPRRAPAPVAGSEWTASGKVETTRTLPTLRHGILFTEVTVSLFQCHKGPCPASFVLEVPGGRRGDIEQIVGSEAVPTPDTPVALTHGDRTGSERGPATALYRLDSGEDLAALRAGLEAAGVSAARVGDSAPLPSHPTQAENR